MRRLPLRARAWAAWHAGLQVPFLALQEARRLVLLVGIAYLHAQLVWLRTRREAMPDPPEPVQVAAAPPEDVAVFIPAVPGREAPRPVTASELPVPRPGSISYVDFKPWPTGGVPAWTTERGKKPS